MDISKHPSFRQLKELILDLAKDVPCDECKELRDQLNGAKSQAKTWKTKFTEIEKALTGQKKEIPSWLIEILCQEAYTSKCDALSFEEIKKHENYLGKRIKRGLFQSSIGRRINADVNGSLNILRKVAGNEFLSSRGFVVNPVKISYDFTKSLVEFL